jgi:hypothetical protein
VVSSISNWVTNRRIVWIAAAITFLGFTGPGLFGVSPPKFFRGHDAVTEQAKIDGLPSGTQSAPVIAPYGMPPDASPAIATTLKTSPDAVDAENGVMRDAPDQTLLSKAPENAKRAEYKPY